MVTVHSITVVSFPYFTAAFMVFSPKVVVVNNAIMKHGQPCYFPCKQIPFKKRVSKVIIERN